jgi:hypothetical protein
LGYNKRQWAPIALVVGRAVIKENPHGERLKSEGLTRLEEENYV